jgi:hypothetical protein
VSTVLITQCLQRDFADPTGAHDPLPDLLHIGCNETVRRGPRIALRRSAIGQIRVLRVAMATQIPRAGAAHNGGYLESFVYRAW